MIKQLILLIWLVISSSVAWSADELFTMDVDWQFHQTDDITLAYTDIPNDSWQVVKPPKLLNTNTKNGIYGWYKVNFDWQKDTGDDWLLYFQSIRYADETWLNGQKIGGLGHIL